MLPNRIKRAPWLCAASFLAVSLTAPVCLQAAHADNPPLADSIGTIEGEAISVQGPMSMETANGQVKTILRSGSEVQVKSGQAHVDLVGGGNITVCGPAHLSLLKSGSSLTIALDSGTVHAHIEGQLTLNVFTAQIQAHPVAIGGGPQDVLVGLDAAGAMCVRAGKGAVRIEQQLTGQSVLIPQNGDMSLTNGQLESLQSSPGRCTCELQLSEQPAQISTEVSALASSDELKKKAAEAKPDPPPQTPPTTDEPIYQVIMPPLRYDAHAKVPHEYDPNLIVLVRRARVRPSLILQGKVEGDPLVAQVSSPPALNGHKPGSSKKPADDTAWNRVRSFFHKLWSPNS